MQGRRSGAVLVAEEQTAGRGRLDRSWQSQPGAALTFSVLLRPASVPAASRGWLPLLTGVAVASALRRRPAWTSASSGRTTCWPRRGAPAARGKLAGILAEQAGDAIVVGIGLNVSAEQDELPSSQATSLWLAGRRRLGREDILVADLARARAVVSALGGRPGAGRRGGVRPARGLPAARARPLAATSGSSCPAAARSPAAPATWTASAGCWSARPTACTRSAPGTSCTSAPARAARRPAVPETPCRDTGAVGARAMQRFVSRWGVWPSAAGLSEGEHLVLKLHQHWKTVLRPLLILAATVVALLVLLLLVPAVRDAAAAGSPSARSRS